MGLHFRCDRLLLHKHLHRLIGDINKLRPVTLAVMDGLVGMQGRGPINGYPIDLDVLLASRDPVALDATAMHLIGLDPATSTHVVHAGRIGFGAWAASPDPRQRPLRRAGNNGGAGRGRLGDQADEPDCQVAATDQETRAERQGFLSGSSGGNACPAPCSGAGCAL